MLGSVHHYAIWDDHEYGPNNSDRSFAGKHWTREAFSLFWVNPELGVEEIGGVTTTFEWGDVQFFLLDDRWDRSPNGRKTGSRMILGERQLEWLIDALASSRATFKIVAIGGQVLNLVAYFENYASYAEERAALLAAIEEEGITGIVFLSGDRHRAELTRFERQGSYPLYDLTVSPLTAGVYAEEEPNALRVEGTFVPERNFAILDFDGPADDRRVMMTIYGSDGAPRWSRTIRASELR
ncbi:MAG: alkaline phosphatase D family protein [Gemmatimonadota bacterium]